jgi:hypothetical protein
VRAASIIRAINETSVYFNDTIRPCIPEGCHILMKVLLTGNTLLTQMNDEDDDNVDVVRLRL